jgi:excisionase family DNA binding protein
MSPTPVPEPAVLTLSEAAAVLRCHPSTLKRIKREIGYALVGGKLLFTRAALEAYLARRSTPPATQQPTPIVEERKRRRATVQPREGLNPVTRLPWGATAHQATR